MPWITDMTAINVVVARMMPNSVRKLRSLLERNESAATSVASRNDAVWAIGLRDDAGGHFVPNFAEPLHQNSVKPEARLGFREKTQVTTMLHGQQTQIGIALKSGMVIHLERDHRIVLGLHQQRGNANLSQEPVRGLSGVIIVRRAESEGWRREPVVEFVHALHSVQVPHLKHTRRYLLVQPDALPEAAQEALRVNGVDWFLELPHASSQVDGGGDGAHAGNPLASALAQFSGEF